jgi:succinate dehydrogenase/fumarate reductase-like Fe-S protein
VQDGERVLNVVRLHESKVTCVLCIALCKATKSNTTFKALSVSGKLVMMKVDAQDTYDVHQDWNN